MTSQVVDPVVIFNPPGKFSATEKDLITKRLVNPLVDYYRMHNDLPKVYGLLISMSDNQAGYLYSVDVLLRGDSKTYTKNGYFGFLYGYPGVALDNWQPECMGECELSKEYKAKYPFIK